MANWKQVAVLHFTGFLLLAYRRWKERIPIDVLIAKRRSNVAPNLRDNFQVRLNGALFSIGNFFMARYRLQSEPPYAAIYLCLASLLFVYTTPICSYLGGLALTYGDVLYTNTSQSFI